MHTHQKNYFGSTLMANKDLSLIILFMDNVLIEVMLKLFGRAPTYLLLPLGKRGSKWGDFHWAMGCV